MVPIAGYADRTVVLLFPELGNGVYVTLRNPKVMPASALRPESIPLGPNGEPDEALAEKAMYGLLARLIRDWHVYDATSDDDEQPLLPLPATGDLVARLPLSIIAKITDEMTKAVNPS